jgi:hypothetical protein
MKPHIVKFRGLWYCYVPGLKRQTLVRDIGEGFNPTDALCNWRTKQALWAAPKDCNA